jgi:hypothetical protein
MKTRSLAVTLCVLILAMTAPSASIASEGNGPANMLIDVLVARPITFAATVIGSALFVVSLPIAATSHSTKSSAKFLVVGPAHDTFTRPLGDFEDFMDY